nr:hypothetical protein [Catenibacterium mitsuokai]
MKTDLLQLEDELSDIYHQVKGLYELVYMIDADKMALFVKNGKSDSKELIAENLNQLSLRLKGCLEQLNDYKLER